MIPRKLQLRNFMCYREDLPPLDFDGIAIACLSGENGAGKSALLDALTWALWGEARLKSDDDLIALGAQEMEVDLIFALDGQEYRVIRKRSKAKRGQSWLDFQVCHNGAWKTLTGGTLRETQQSITSTLHMSYETFTNSAFLRQGHADAFTRKEPGKRKQVLADILGLDVYEGLEASSKERAKGLDSDIKVLDGRIGELQVRADKQQISMDLVREAEGRVADSEGRVATAQHNLEAAERQVQALERVKDQRDEQLRRISDLRRLHDDLRALLDERSKKLDVAYTFRDRHDEIVAGVAQLRAAEAELEQLEALRTSYFALNERRRDALDAVQRVRHGIEVQRSAVAAQLQRLREDINERPRIEARIAELRGRLQGGERIEDEVETARQRNDDLQERRNQSHKLQAERDKLQHQIDMKHDSLVATREELKRRVSQASDELKHADRWRVDLGQAGTERMRLEQDQQRLDRLRAEDREGVERISMLRADCNTIKAQGEEIGKKLAMLRADTSACPLCGHELGDNGIAHIEAEYEQQRTQLRAEYKQRDAEVRQIDQSLNSLRGDIRALETRTGTLAEVAGRIARLESDLQKADEVRTRHADDQRTLSELELTLLKGNYEQGLRAQLGETDAQIRALGKPENFDREISQMRSRIIKLEQQLADQKKDRADLDKYTQQLNDIERRTPELHDLEEQVREIDARLDAEQYGPEERAALAAAEAEITALGYSNERHNSARTVARDLQPWLKEENRLQRSEEFIADNQPQQERDQATFDRYQIQLGEEETTLAGLQQQLGELATATRRRDEARGALGVYQRELSVAQRDLGEKQRDLASAEEAAVQLLDAQAQRRKRVTRKTLFDELSLAFGKKGVQALLIETAIPEIEREANTLLGDMTDNQMHLTFATQRDTKKGDVAETLDIRIADALGTRDYDAYSGGESFRVDFAIRIALAKLLARRAGARLETLVIDEGFGSQDAKGRERLVEAITTIQRDFKQILVVTHIQELKDMFPTFIEITKTDQGSTWALG